MKKVLMGFLTAYLISVLCICAFGQKTVAPDSYVQANSDVVKCGLAIATNIQGQLSMWSGCDASFTMDISAKGMYRLAVLAWGTPALDDLGKLWPIMTLTIDGEEMCRWEVNGDQSIYVSTPLNLKHGQYHASLSFINDSSNSALNQDRNLFIKGFTLGSVKTPASLPEVSVNDKQLSSYSRIVNAVPPPVKQTASKSINIPPYYPKARNQRYVSKLIARNEISVKLANGIYVKPSNYDRIVSLDGTWKCSGLKNSKTAFTFGDNPEYAAAGFNDSSWDDITVPSNWYDKYNQARKSDAAFVSGWYRKSLTIPAEENNNCVTVHFGVIGYEAQLYINGEYAGTHHGDFTPWKADITKFVKYGQTNILALHVLSDFGDSYGTGKPVQHVYGSQWSIDNIKGGLWQNVSLHYTPKIHFNKVNITPRLASHSIEVEYWVTSNAAVSVDMESVVSSAMKSAKQVSIGKSTARISLKPGENHGTAVIKLKNPKLWTPDNPYLYYLTLALTNDRRIVTAHIERFGYREFKAKGTHFYLNGKRIYLFGENLASVGFSGTTKKPEEETKRIADILLGFKNHGYNIIRTPHMPIISQVLDTADEVGLMIYDEWGWSFSTSLDVSEFEKRNIQEITEWVYRDYNHPSVVMWSCGNEVNYGSSENAYIQLNKQLNQVRSLEKGTRPAGSFSGSAFDFGTKKLETDQLDLHTYIGLGWQPWTKLQEHLNNVFKADTATYGINGRLNMPFIIWECVGFSWGESSNTDFRIGDIDHYYAYANKPTNWGAPNGIGFSGCIGLAAALDPTKGCGYGQHVYGKRILDLVRYDTRVDGYAPWFLNPNLDASTLWNQPVFCGLRNPNGSTVTLRHTFAGRTYKQRLFIVNSSNESYKNLSLAVTVMDSIGRSYNIAKTDISSLAAWTKYENSIDLKFPENLGSGSYQIRLLLKNNGRELSRDFYDISIKNPQIVRQPIKTDKKVAILLPEDDLGRSFAGILTDLSIKADQITDAAQLANYNVVILPPAMKRHSFMDNAANMKALMKWVEEGGVLAAMEQNYISRIWLGGNLSSADNTYVDLVIPQHPIFKGLTQGDFDTWDSPNFGYIIHSGINPFTVNALAARGPLLGSTGVLTAVAEGSKGKGRILMNQLETTGLWNIDSAVTAYIRNFLQYALSGNAVKGIRPWSTDKEEFDLSADEVQPVNLRKYANRGFRDDVDGDQLGGWTDQGENDFRSMPLGSYKAAGIPFEIIDPATNADKACIVLKGGAKQYFPQDVNGIEVNSKYSDLFFLQGIAWGGGGGIVGNYHVNYADGTSADIPLKDGDNIADWFYPGSLPNAVIGVSGRNPKGADVGIWMYRWKNPKPEVEIKSIDFHSAGNGPVPILVAVTGKKL